MHAVVSAFLGPVPGWLAGLWPWGYGAIVFIAVMHVLALRFRDAPMRLIALAVYAVLYGIFFYVNGVIIDRVSVTISVLALLAIGCVGQPPMRWVIMVRDILLYALMWFAYENSRGFGNRVAMPLQVQTPRNIDRAIFFGADPNVWMQRHLFESDVSRYVTGKIPSNPVRWWDVFGGILYYSHFIVPPLVIAILWIANHKEWVRFMRRFATLLFVACLTFVLAPTAPPWMAAGGGPYKGRTYHELAPLARITGRGASHIGLKGFVKNWEFATQAKWSNPVAAMPSLHAGFAFIVVVFFWPKIRRWWINVPLLVLYPMCMIAALVYFGEHYVADALGSWLIIGAAFWFWGWVERNYVWKDWWFRRRTPDDTQPPPPPSFDGDDMIPSRAVVDLDRTPVDAARPEAEAVSLRTASPSDRPATA